MKTKTFLTLLVFSVFCVNAFCEESEVCPNPQVEKYKSVQKEFDNVAMDDAMRTGARVVVMIPGIIKKNFDLENFNGDVWQEIKGGYECMKDTLTGGAEWYNTVQKATFCPVSTLTGVVVDTSETIVKSVAQVPHVIGDLADLGDNLAQAGLEKTLELSRNPDFILAFAGILGTIPMGVIDLAFKATSLVTHFVGNLVDTIINYNLAGAAMSAVRIGQGFYLLNPETIVDSSKELGCRVGTIPEVIYYSLGDKIEPRPIKSSIKPYCDVRRGDCTEYD
ncbi:MAG: hypothetical protein SGJ18_05775 [Pseudomonadota bacterium]|nr:hypothetical protein [Pseudomonadota bacterium]